MIRSYLLFSCLLVTCASSAVSSAACNDNALSIQVVDEVRGGVKASAAEVSDPAFRSFVSIVSSSVERLMQERGKCIEEGDNAPNLMFVRTPLVQDRPAMALPSIFSGSDFKGCRIHSPWMNLEIDNSGAKIRGIIRLNQRQLLMDQAIMAGGIQVADARVAVLSGDDFRKYEKAYVDSEFYRRPSDLPLSSMMPLDILWLFQNSLQSTRGPFSSSALRAMNNLEGRSVEGYAGLVISLIDRCISSGQGDFRYRSILNLKNVAPIDKYKIEKLL